MGFKFIGAPESAQLLDQPAAFTAGVADTPDLIDGRWYYPLLRVTSSNLSLDGAVEGGFAGLFGSISADRHYHVLELTSTVPLLGHSPAGNDAVFGRHLVAGLKTADAAVAMSYAIAKATAENKTNSSSVITQGVGDAATDTLRKAVGGSLSVESAPTFGQGLSECIDWAVSHAPDPAAKPGAVYELTPREVDDTASLCFALGQIASGKSLDQARAHLQQQQTAAATRPAYAAVNEVVVAATYHRFGASGSQSISQEKRSIANGLLNGGDGIGAVPPPNNAPGFFEVPVLPYLTKGSRAIASLQYLVGDAKRVAANPWPAQELGPPEQDIGQRELTLAATLDLGLSVLADVHAKLDYRFFDYHATSVYSRSGAPNTIIATEKYTAGIRATVRYLGNDVNVATQVAAKVSLGQTSAAYSIDVIGVDIEKIPSIAAFTGGCLGPFDVQALARIGVVWKEVNSVITAPNPAAQGWRPCLSAVVLKLDAPELQAKVDHAGGLTYGLAKIARWKLSRDQALSQSPANYVDDVKAIYARLGVTAAPSDSAVNQAKSILQVGR
jgi:hypothetical protein